MRDLLSYIILPIPSFGILILIALILRLRNKKRWSKIILSISAFWFLLISSSFLPDILTRNLESKYPTLQADFLNSFDDSVNILVLGGGHANDPRLVPHNKLSPNTLSRIVEGVRIYKNTKHPTLITSGTGKRSEISNAEVVAETAILLGVNKADIRLNTTPTNTNKEALEYKKNFGTDKKLILVTSAAHMPRSVYLFRQAGLDPIPAPTDHLYKKDQDRPRFFWVPSANNIRKLESTIHEYVGLIYYRLRK